MDKKWNPEEYNNFDMTLEECRRVFDAIENLVIVDADGNIKYLSPNMYFYCKVFLTLFGSPYSFDLFSALVDFSHIFAIRDGIRPVYYGVQMVIFRAIREEKSKFSAVSVWFVWILLSWCYHYSISSFPLLVSNVNSISINTSIKALSSSLNNL